MVAYRKINKGDKLLYDDLSLLKDFQIIRNPFNKWVADPFPLTFEGKTYIFAEIAGKIKRKGNICYGCLNDKKVKWKTCFKPKFHISFPNVFIDNGKVFAIPETYQDKCVGLYSLTAFPYGWKKTKVMFDFPHAVDTIFANENHKDVFIYSSETDCDIPVLKLINVDEPDNPKFSIVDEEKKFRPAGNAFKVGGNIIVPTQDGSKHYGCGLFFRKLGNKKLEIVSSVHADDLNKFLHMRNLTGIHTYNFNENIEVIDLVVNQFDILALVGKAYSKIITLLKK